MVHNRAWRHGAATPPHAFGTRYRPTGGCALLLHLLKHQRLALRAVTLLCVVCALVSVASCTSGDEAAFVSDMPEQVRDLPRAVVVSRSQCVLHYFEDGELVASMDAVIGAMETPTPIGEARVWKSEPMDPEGAYGAWRVSIEYLMPESGAWERAAFAIHGTNEPELLGRPVPRLFSNGCVRLVHDDIMWLSRRLEEGDAVYVVR